MRDLMNTVKDLFEMPEMIGDEDFGLESDVINKEMAQSFLRDKDTQNLGKLKNHTLYKQNNRLALIDTTVGETPHILYYLKYEINHLNILNCDAAQQVAVWKEHGGETNDIASEMFFTFLLPLVGCIVTDLYQTTYGKRFWLDRVADAIKIGLKVLYINTDTNKITTINDMNKLKSLQKEIWGDGEQYQHRRVVIAK